MNLIEYSLAVFFFFYLVNYAEGFAGKLENLFYEYGDIISSFWNYAISCAFCFTFWGSLFGYLVGLTPQYYLVTAPVIVLGINLAYKNLIVEDELEESHGTRIARELRAKCNLMTPEQKEEALKRGMEIINGKN